MNNFSADQLVLEKPKGFRGFLRMIQNKISTSPSSYLAYTFIIPVFLMYLIYVSQGIHPFGDGSVLVLDLNAQYVYFFESLRNAVYGEGSFLYTFFRTMGGEYVGMYAYYLASPLSYIVCLFPQNRILEALLAMFLLKTGLCGLTFGFYLHKNSRHPNKIMVVAFSVMYSLMAYAVVHQNNTMWTDAIILLPILTYSIEQLIKRKKYKLFVMSLSLIMISNFYIGYMACIYSVIYYFYYYYSNEKTVINPTNEYKHGMRAFVRFGIFAVIAAAIAAFILLGAYYSLTFGKDDFSNPSWALKAKFDLLDFFTKFLPGAYDTVRPEGLPFVYCGLLTLIMIPVYFMTKAIRSREKIASLAFIGVFLISFLASPLDLIWHGFQVPNWLNYRYSFMLCFFLLVLGYKAFGNLRKFNEKFILAISAFLVLFVCICQKLEFETYRVSDETIATFETVWLTIIITAILFALLCTLIRTKNRRKREGLTAVLAVVICLELFGNALACVIKFDNDVVYSGYDGYNNFISGVREAVEELKEYDSSFYRAEKLVHRKYNDNMALGLRGLSNSTSTLNAETINFLNNMGYTSRSHLSKYQGGNPVNDTLLGIKYLIDNKDSEKLVHYYDKILSTELYDIYSNPNYLSIAYGANEAVKEFNFHQYNTYFEKLNGLVTALCGRDEALEVFKPIKEFDVNTRGCTVTEGASATTYTAENENVTATIMYMFVAEESAEYYFFTPCQTYNKSSLSVNGTSLGEYLGNDTKHIFSLGWFEKGDIVTAKITLNEGPLSVINDRNYIWYIDRDNYDDAFAQLKNNPQFIIEEEYKEDHLTGTITTTEANTTIFTTIPFDEGWKVYVDGEKLETYKTLNALIAFDIAEIGEHSLEMKYWPDIYQLGMTVSIGGISAFVLICTIDLVLKKTLFKNKKPTVQESYWVLEDFDDDFEQPYEEADEYAQRKGLLKYLPFIKSKINDSQSEDISNDDDNNGGA